MMLLLSTKKESEINRFGNPESSHTQHALGPANFLYWDGDVMIAHGDRRHQTSGVIGPPGLHVLIRECPPSGSEFEAEGLTVDAARQRVVLIASVALTDEPWRSFGSGEIIMAADGQLIASTGPK